MHTLNINCSFLHTNCMQEKKTFAYKQNDPIGVFHGGFEIFTSRIKYNSIKVN